MSFSDQYRRKSQQARDKIATLQKDKGRLAAKVAGLQKKINAAQASASKTGSASTMNSKLREAERASKDLATTEGKIASIESKIAAEHKKLSCAQQSLSREEVKEAKTREQNADWRARQTKQRMSSIATTLSQHKALHEETMSELEKLKNVPERITVLFFASNPLDQEELRLDEEVRAIQDMIRKSKHRDSVKLESCWAVRPLDVIQAINEHDPAIVHFSGHGSDEYEIVFQDEAGETKLVTKEAIVQVMRACSGSIRLVFFNTCYSRDQAEAVVEHVEAAVGMNTSIGDDAARVFSSQFYSAIGFGKSVKTAFEQAKTALMLESILEEDTPELFVSDGIQPDDLIIVRPADNDDA